MGCIKSKTYFYIMTKINNSIDNKTRFSHIITTLILTFGVFSCSTSNDEILDTTNPNVTLSNILVVDSDADGIINDITGNIDATDNEAVISKTIKAGNIDGVISGNTFIIKNVPTGIQSVVGKAKDIAGNEGSDTKSITVPDYISISYKVTNTVSPVTTDVPEETAIKLANFTTVVDKITNTNGVETNRETISNPTLVYSEYNTDNYNLENGEFYVKEAGTKDADNTDGSNIPDVYRKYTVTVKTEFTAPDGTVYSDTDPVNKEFTDTDDFAPFPGLVVEHNGDIRPEYTNTVAMANSLEWNLAERTNLNMLNALAAAAGTDFTVEKVAIGGLNWPYLTYQGQRIDGLTMSRILDAYYQAKENSQNDTAANMIINTDFKNYLATALQNAIFVTYSGTPGASDYDAGSEIELSIEDAAKAGAAVIVAKNKIDGLY
jgi:hypothetical protein